MSKITESARGKPCQIRIVGVCSHDESTTVYVHYRRLYLAAGIGLAPSDLFGAYACAACQAAVEGRLKTNMSQGDLDQLHMTGVFRTQHLLLNLGLIRTAEAKVLGRDMGR